MRARRIQKKRLLHYGVAVLSVALALGLALLLSPWLYPTITPLFFVAVISSAWLGGWESGVLAAILSTLAISYFFIEPLYSLQLFNVGTGVRLGLFLTVVGLVSWLAQSQRMALEAARANNQALKKTMEREEATRIKGKQTEAALQVAQENLAIAVEAAQMGTWYLDLTQGVASERSLRHDQIYGYDTLQPQWGPEIAKRHMVKEDRKIFDAAFARAMETGELDFEARIQWFDGSIHWMAVRGRFYFDETGTPLYGGGVNFDITERKRAEAALVEQRRLYEAVLTTTPDLAYVFDLNHRFIYANQGLLKMWGKTWDEAIGRNCLELGYEPWHAQMHDREIEQVIRTKQPIRGEVPFSGSFGRRIYDYIFTPVFDEQGQVVAVAGTTRDISDSKQAEIALRESEDRLRMAIESAQLGTWDWNLNTNELIWDEGCKAMFGLSPDAESSIEVFFAGLHPDEREQMEQVVQWALNPASDGKYDAEYRTIGIQDGIERWIAAKGQAYFDATGTPQRFVGTVLNITEQKRIEAEREQLLVREQTARESADRANRVKDEFLAVLSHELRSPLNPILGWSRLLQNGNLDAARTAHALATIERNAKLQSELIEDLLDVSRILQGKLSLNVSSIDLETTVRSAIETVRLAAEAKSIAVEADLDPSVGLVSGDSTRLQQVMWNLLSNAVKFTPVGGRVALRLEQVDNQAQITVSDNGKGIPASFLPHVFDYCRQEDGATTRKFGGLGLGLAIVRHLVELHGGTVKAESPGEGQGAAFTVKLPLMSIQFAPKPNRPHAEPSLNLNGVQVLVVDDETDSREFVAFVLEQAGATVRTAPTASEGFLLFTQSPPDILLSDIGMPNMDGYMLMRQIRALAPAQGGQVKAIALTAYAGEINQQQAMAAGYQQHLSKPVEPAQLVQTIAELMQDV